MLDVLAAVDRIDAVEVVVHLVDPTKRRRVLASTRVPADAPRLPSVAGTFAAAYWHEREAAEMFGVEFVGHPDPRPLLLRDQSAQAPLLKSSPLAARLATPWPGAGETDGGRKARRPQLPPGVRAEWTQGAAP
jgi:NADH-quinone oxidoreductase subunit C